MKFQGRVLYFSMLFCLVFNLNAQNIPFTQKEEFLHLSKQNLEKSVDERTMVEYPYVIGKYHVPVTNKVNHPYFGENEWGSGTLVFKGNGFEVNGLKYDIVNDRPIFLMYSDAFRVNSVALDKNFVTDFSLQNKNFRYFNGLRGFLGIRKKDGYYEVVYDGSLKFLARWEKSKSLSDNSTLIKYKATSDLYLLDDDRVKTVHNMAKLKRQLKDKKKEIKKLTSNNNLRLNRSNYASAFDVLLYYENLQEQ